MSSYTIISVSDRREESKNKIRNAMYNFDEVTDIEFVGSDHDIEQEIYDAGLWADEWMPTLGEAGVWMSQWNCWQWVIDNDKPLIVFEDDAIVNPDFREWYDMITLDTIAVGTTPDVLALFVPSNQYTSAYNNILSQGKEVYNSLYLTRAYQGYSCVGIQYWPSGAKKLSALAQEYGLYTPVDCFLFETGTDANSEFRVSGVEIWAPKPDYCEGVDVDWDGPSERLKATEIRTVDRDLMLRKNSG